MYACILKMEEILFYHYKKLKVSILVLAFMLIFLTEASFFVCQCDGTKINLYSVCSLRDIDQYF